MKLFRKNQKGQMTIEAVLLLTIFVSFFTLVKKGVEEQEWFNQLISGPWVLIQGMSENGVWQPVREGKSNHPNTFKRRASPEPF